MQGLPADLSDIVNEKLPRMYHKLEFHSCEEKLWRNVGEIHEWWERMKKIHLCMKKIRTLWRDVHREKYFICLHCYLCIHIS